MPARAPTSSHATPAPSAAECRLIGPGDQQLDTRPDQAVARRAASEWSVLSVDELYACVTGSARSHQGITVHRTRRLAAIVAAGVPTRSELEDATLDLLLRGGLAHPDVNRPLILSGRRVIPDFRWLAQRLVVEADGAAWHDNPLARADDAERQKLLEAHGERVVRVTWTQVISRPRQTLARIRAAGAPVVHPAST